MNPPVKLTIRICALALCFVLVPGTAAAQASGTISGTVRNARTNQPLPGVQIILEGTARGTLTGPSGSYTLPDVAPGSYTVQARSLGFQASTAEVTVGAGAAARADFALRESAVELEEIVVTGQGTGTELRKLSTNVDVLGSREIDEAPVTDVGQLLQGRVPGATVQAVSAQPGQAPLVRFRGVSSVFGSQTPVIYIDGVRVDNSMGSGFDTGGEATSALAQILASDIERIEIIKGGAASTLYGSDAATGVIQIFTKRGIAGAPRVTARVEQGFDRAETKFIQDVDFAFPAESYPQLREDPNYNPDFFKDNFFQTGYFQNYYAGVSGGTQGATYNLSGRVQNGTGVQPNNENTIYSLRGGVHAAMSEVLSFDFTGSYTRDHFERLFNGDFYEDPTTAFEVGDAIFLTGADTFEEALDIFLRPSIDEEVSRFIFGSTAHYQPSSVFNSRFTVGVDYRANEQRTRRPIDYPIDDPDVGVIQRYNRDFATVTLEYAGTVAYPQEGRFTSDFTFGVQGFREDESQIFATGRNFSLPGATDFDAAANITAEEINSEIFNGGIFFQERVGLWDRLFLEAGLRLDGNSAFGQEVGLQAYPKFGASYNISDEPWWADGLGQYASAVKLRVAYGEAGKFPEPFVRDRTYEAVPFRGESAPRFFNPGDENLKPEVTATFETGFDAGLLDDRLGINFTYYNAVTEDALFFVSEQPSTGFRRDQLRNVGEITNRGIELAANLGVIRSRNVDWDIGATYNTVDNEVTDMGGVAPFTIGTYGNGRVAEGRPVGAYFVSHPIDRNGDGLPDDVERQYVGTQPYPTRTGSFNTDLRLFGTISVTALADWARGSTVLDAGSGWATFNNLERVTFPMRFTLDGEEDRRFRFREAYSSLLLNGDYTKLREVTVRYALPPALSRRWGTQSGSIYLTGRNLYTWVPDRQCLFAEDCLSNLVDPELSGLRSSGNLQLGGASSITIPSPRQFRLGVEVSF
jgi:TonB-linked SusC/RagA family outer membrane protein